MNHNNEANILAGNLLTDLGIVMAKSVAKSTHDYYKPKLMDWLNGGDVGVQKLAMLQFIEKGHALHDARLSAIERALGLPEYSIADHRIYLGRK